MRICFIGHQGTKEGAGNFMLDQVDYLQSKNVTVFAILPENGPLGEALALRGVEFRTVKNPWWTKGQFQGTEAEYRLTSNSANQMAELFRRWKIDLVYTQTVVAPAGPMAAAMAGKPHVWHIHEFSYNPECIEMAIPQKELGRLMELTSNHIIFNSRAVAAEWDNYLPAAKTKIVRNWISPEQKSLAKNDLDAKSAAPELSAATDQFVIAMVASVLPWKRQFDAVKAVANLLRENFDVLLLVVGPVLDESYLNDIKAFVKKHGLEDKVRFLGYQKNPAQIMKQARVTLVCSRLEPFGRITVESMACGVPVIGADSGGTPEIIENEASGLLFSVGDVEALTAQLRRTIQDKTLLTTLGQNALKRAESFNSAEREMGPLLELLRGLVSETNPSWPLAKFQALGRHVPGMESEDLSVREIGRTLAGKIRRRVHKLAS